jgi:hypothetical protein
MNRKFVVCLLAFVSLSADSLFGSAACAQDTPKFDVFAGYSYVRENPLLASNGFNLHAGSASIAYNANHWLSGVADFGGYHSNNILGTGVDGTLPLISSAHGSPSTAIRAYLLTRFNEFGTGAQTQNNLRVSTGVVFHF